MRLVLLWLALLISPFSAAAQLPDEAPAYTIERSVVTHLAAADGRDYRVFVAWPDTPPPPTGWPVLYVLDGEDNFAVAVVTARRLARAGPRSGIAPGLVVAIEAGDLPRRVLDYTPASPGYTIPQGAPAHGLATGGADAFLDFVADRVQPMVAGRWKVDPARRTLFGHSFGGLLALHSLFTRPGLFSGYVAVSPSLWFGGDLLPAEESSFVATTDTRLLFASGDERGPDPSASGAGVALVGRLGERGMPARYLALPGQGHGTTMLAAMGQAIEFAFGEKRR